MRSRFIWIMLIAFAVCSQSVFANDLTLELNNLGFRIDAALVKNKIQPELPKLRELTQLQTKYEALATREPLSEFGSQLRAVSKLFSAYVPYADTYSPEFVFMTTRTIMFMNLFLSRLERDGYPAGFDRPRIITGFGQTLSGVVIIVTANGELSDSVRTSIARKVFPVINEKWGLLPVTVQTQIVTTLKAALPDEPSVELANLMKGFLAGKSFAEMYRTPQ